MALLSLAAPTAEPLTLAEAKAWLRLDTTEDELRRYAADQRGAPGRGGGGAGAPCQPEMALDPRRLATQPRAARALRAAAQRRRPADLQCCWSGHHAASDSVARRHGLAALAHCTGGLRSGSGEGAERHRDRPDGGARSQRGRGSGTAAAGGSADAGLSLREPRRCGGPWHGRRCCPLRRRRWSRRGASGGCEMAAQPTPRAEIAALRTRLTLESPTETPDAAGGVTRSWATTATAWGRIQPLGGDDSRRGRRSRPDGQPPHHTALAHGGGRGHAAGTRARRFSIRSVYDPQERRKALICLCDEVKP